MLCAVVRFVLSTIGLHAVHKLPKAPAYPARRGPSFPVAFEKTKDSGRPAGSNAVNPVRGRSLWYMCHDDKAAAKVIGQRRRTQKL